MKISPSCSVCLGRDICDINERRKYNDIACQNFHKLVEEKFTSTNSAQDEITYLINKLCQYTCELNKNNHIRRISERLRQLTACSKEEET